MLRRNCKPYFVVSWLLFTVGCATGNHLPEIEICTLRVASGVFACGDYTIPLTDPRVNDLLCTPSVDFGDLVKAARNTK